jgi:prepilin-type N-terminal cleavage/methylation domain-containing protein
MHKMKRNQKGFTLRELMVVIVIVAILAAVAVPLYINYVKDAQRTEAKGAIGAVITAEQTFFQLNPDGGPQEYTVDTFVANPGANPGTQKLNCDLTEALKSWDISVTAADANGFTVLATGKAGQPTAGLTVQYVYSRTGTGAGTGWTES